MMRLVPRLRRPLFFISISALLGAAFFGCSDSDNSAGATIETTNGSVSAIVISENGDPVQGAAVYLRLRDGLRGPDQAALPPSTYTDNTGRFTLSGLDTALFIVEVVDTASRSAVQIIPTVGSEGRIEIPPYAGIRATGSISGTIVRADSSILGRISVCVVGLDRRVVPDSITGAFIIAGLPGGTIRLRIATDLGIVIAPEDSFTIEGGANTDAGIYRTGNSFAAEILIVQQILHLNGLDTVAVSSVIDSVDGRINTLDLDSMGITVLPPDIGRLRLRWLNLARNNLSTLPDEIGNIVTLIYADLSGNQLSVLPESMGKLSQCTMLDIGDNNLGSLPQSLISLPRLGELYLNGNALLSLSQPLLQWVNDHSSDPDWLKTQQ